MLTGVYFSRKLERSRILFCYPRRLFLLLLCLFFFLFSFFSLFFTVFLVRGFFPSFAYRVGCDHLHSSVLWTTRNPQPLSTDCNNLFYLSLVFFPLSSSLHFVFLPLYCLFFAALLTFFPLLFLSPLRQSTVLRCTFSCFIVALRIFLPFCVLF